MSSSDSTGSQSPLLDNIQTSEHLSDDFVTQGNRLRDCGVGFHVFMCNCNYLKVKKRCNYRVCPDCGKVRSLKLFDQYMEILKKKPVSHYPNAKGLKFLTLTLYSQEEIAEGLDHLYESITRFKRDKYIKDRILGALGCIEIKRGVTGFNIHVHLIIHSKYLDMRSHKKTGNDSKLVEIWRRCSRGSHILDVRTIKDRIISLRYILKYVTKGALNLSPEDRAKFFEKTYKRRLLFTWGDFYNVPKIKKTGRVCEDCGSQYTYVFEGSEEFRALFGLGEFARRKKIYFLISETGVRLKDGG